MSTGRSNPTRPGSSRTRWGAGAIRASNYPFSAPSRSFQPLQSAVNMRRRCRRQPCRFKRSHEIVGAFHDRVQTPDLATSARTSRVG